MISGDKLARIAVTIATAITLPMAVSGRSEEANLIPKGDVSSDTRWDLKLPKRSGEQLFMGGAFVMKLFLTLATSEKVNHWFSIEHLTYALLAFHFIITFVIFVSCLCCGYDKYPKEEHDENEECNNGARKLKNEWLLVGTAFPYLGYFGIVAVINIQPMDSNNTSGNGTNILDRNLIYCNKAMFFLDAIDTLFLFALYLQGFPFTKKETNATNTEIPDTMTYELERRNRQQATKNLTGWFLLGTTLAAHLLQFIFPFLFEQTFEGIFLNACHLRIPLAFFRSLGLLFPFFLILRILQPSKFAWDSYSEQLPQHPRPIAILVYLVVSCVVMGTGIATNQGLGTTADEHTYLVWFFYFGVAWIGLMILLQLGTILWISWSSGYKGKFRHLLQCSNHPKELFLYVTMLYVFAFIPLEGYVSYAAYKGVENSPEYPHISEKMRALEALGPFDVLLGGIFLWCKRSNMWTKCLPESLENNSGILRWIVIAHNACMWAWDVMLTAQSSTYTSPTTSKDGNGCYDLSRTSLKDEPALLLASAYPIFATTRFLLALMLFLSQPRPS